MNTNAEDNVLNVDDMLESTSVVHCSENRNVKAGRAWYVVCGWKWLCKYSAIARQEITT